MADVVLSSSVSAVRQLRADICQSNGAALQIPDQFVPFFIDSLRTS
jgi:hypothetical protein